MATIREYSAELARLRIAASRFPSDIDGGEERAESALFRDAFARQLIENQDLLVQVAGDMEIGGSFKPRVAFEIDGPGTGPTGKTIVDVIDAHMADGVRLLQLRDVRIGAVDLYSALADRFEGSILFVEANRAVAEQRQALSMATTYREIGKDIDLSILLDGVEVVWLGERFDVHDKVARGFVDRVQAAGIDVVFVDVPRYGGFVVPAFDPEVIVSVPGDKIAIRDLRSEASTALSR